MTKASGELFQHLLLLLECSLFCSCLPTQHTQHMISTSKLANVGLVSFGLAGVVSLHFRDGNGKPIQKSRSNILEWTQGTNVEQTHQAEPIPKQRFLLTPSLSLSLAFFSAAKIRWPFWWARSQRLANHTCWDATKQGCMIQYCFQIDQIDNGLAQVTFCGYQSNTYQHLSIRGMDPSSRSSRFHVRSLALEQVVDAKANGLYRGVSENSNEVSWYPRKIATKIAKIRFWTIKLGGFPNRNALYLLAANLCTLARLRSFAPRSSAAWESGTKCIGRLVWNSVWRLQ